MRNFDAETQTRTKIFNKRSLQATLKEFRSKGYKVEKGQDIYEVLDGEQLVFQALNGYNSYLVRLDKQLLAEEA